MQNHALSYNNYSIKLSRQSQGRKPRGISNVHVAVYNLMHDLSLFSTHICTSFEWILKTTVVNEV